MDQSAIAHALGVSWPFVHKTVCVYQKRGFLGLLEHHPGARSHLTEEQILQVLHWVELGPKAYHYHFAQWDTRSLRWRIKQVYNVELSREAIRQLLHRHKFRWKRPKSTYDRVDHEARRRTQEKLNGLFEKAQNGEIVLLLQDEAIVTLVTTLQCGWSRKGIQVEIPSTGKHGEGNRCAVFAVVNPLTGEVHYRIFDTINQKNMIRFLRHLGRYYRNSPIPVWMVLDNHPAHKKLDHVFEEVGIHPSYLEPYCGDLNGIEHLWAWMRERNLHNVFFQRMEQVKAAIREFFCYIAGVKKQVTARVA